RQIQLYNISSVNLTGTSASYAVPFFYIGEVISFKLRKAIIVVKIKPTIKANLLLTLFPMIFLLLFKNMGLNFIRSKV
ncbi:hypothetical protein, partial [Companilactobacillus tucceti]|uniref:hypothetical protein n=1 Tax=Companilactobacillus tucceti TaxID=238012 RepID=UPI000AF26A43